MDAVIDIGSNTIRMVFYRKTENGYKAMLGSKEVAGLIGYIDESGAMSEAGIKRAEEVLRRFQSILESVQVEHLMVFATAPFRNICNTEEVVDRLKNECGLEIKVLSGEEEATYDFCGAVKGFSQSEGLMADVGGGSTELVFFKDQKVISAHSIPVGSLNMWRRFSSGILPDRKALQEIEDFVGSLLKKIEKPVELSERITLCGVGGTARASCALSDELYQETNGYNGYACKRFKKILKMAHKEKKTLVSALIRVAPDRLHTMLPGLAILKTVAAAYGCEAFTVSPNGVREGYLLCHAEHTAEHTAEHAAEHTEDGNRR